MPGWPEGVRDAQNLKRRDPGGSVLGGSGGTRTRNPEPEAGLQSRCVYLFRHAPGAATYTVAALSFGARSGAGIASTR